MLITLDLPEGLAERLRSLEDQLPRQPTPQEVLALRPSEALQARINAFLEKNRADGLSTAEAEEWEHYQYLEHLVRIAKAHAALKLQAS